MEKRAFSRVETYLRGRIRILKEEGASPVFSGFLSAESPVGEKELENAHIPEKLVSFLLNMDSKLNAILGHLQRDQLQEDFPDRVEIMEISGAGIRMVPPPGISVGDTVELVIFLSEFPLRAVGAIGKVLRCDTLRQQDCVALEFTRIREEDLEAIVQFVFQEERRKLRAQRLE